jgi:FKBP-type peptidyl-prolyl cis-trans isomerase 2
MRRLLRAGALLAPLLHPGAAPAEEPAADRVADGRQVSLEFTISLADGRQARSNVGREPLVYRQGQGELFPALEAALAGAKEGESRQVKLPPVEAYGERNPDLVIEVETERVPEEARKPGALLSTRDANDEPRVVRVQEVRGDRVVIDLNHPLAGETLVFDVKILDVQ